MNVVWPCVSLVAVGLGLCACAAPAPFRAGERVGFSGDSISEAGNQAFYLEYLSAIRHPGRGARVALDAQGALSLAAVRPVAWALSLRAVQSDGGME